MTLFPIHSTEEGIVIFSAYTYPNARSLISVSPSLKSTSFSLLHSMKQDFPITRREEGMATFCSEYDLDFSTEATKDIAAYVAIGYNSETKKVTMLRVTEVQSGTGLLIVGKPGSYTIPVKATSRNYNNMLTAVGEETTLSDTDCYDICYDNYLLSGSVFTKADETPIPAYQAYLKLAQIMAHTPESVSLEFIDMGDMNSDAKITITDAVMIVDKILNEQ